MSEMVSVPVMSKWKHRVTASIWILDGATITDGGTNALIDVRCGQTWRRNVLWTEFVAEHDRLGRSTR